MTTQSSLSAISGRAARAALVLSLLAFAGSAAADGYHDRVHADSFGNLIVHSPGGYKRIIVGQGHLARDLVEYGGGAPEVVLLDRSDEDGVVRRCRAPGVLLHGRSYMYGLPDDVVPVPAHPCR